MEPRSLERGEVSVVRLSVQWPRASMEPRSLERGEPSSSFCRTIWFRGFNGAALVRARRVLGGFEGGTRFIRASMEPRSLERGELRLGYRPERGLFASMEPRSLERGEGASCQRTRRAPWWLQWSRAR